MQRNASQTYCLLYLSSLKLVSDCTVAMQTERFIEELEKRDQKRGLDYPVLEEICLLECLKRDEHFHRLNKRFKTVLCQGKEPIVQDSSTWVMSSKPFTA